MLSVCIISCDKEVRGEEMRAAVSPGPPFQREAGAHVRDDGHPEVCHVRDDLAVLRRDLGMLDQLVQVFLGDACENKTPITTPANVHRTLRSRAKCLGLGMVPPLLLSISGTNPLIVSTLL